MHEVCRETKGTRQERTQWDSQIESSRPERAGKLIIHAVQFKAFQDQLEEVADKEEEDTPVVYRTRKLLYIYSILYIMG